MWLLLSVVALLAASSSAKTVQTVYGPVDGNTVTLDDGTVINSWQGIPFAKPPIGDLRFEPPQPPERWTEVFEAKTLPKACMQDPVGVIWVTHPNYNNVSEDCLNLNVFSPEDLSEGPLPVMVWFYGGGYISGANIQYPGHFLAAKGVVVVVPNYRVGAFGFLATPDGTIPGNMGLKDQALSLLWVRNNIVSFGGDPNKVTIFGQSAGASSSSLHMVSPFSQGLYHQAIMESGTEGNLWTLNYPGSNPENFVYQTAEKVNCMLPTDPEIVECLRSKTAARIRLAQDLECTPGYFCQGYAPIVDGPGGFIPKLPWELRDEQDESDFVPIITGICRDDGSLYTLFLVPESWDSGFNSTEFDYYLRTGFVDIFGGLLDEEQYEDVVDALSWYYVNWPYLEDLDANREAFNMMTTDGAFGYAWDRQAKKNAVNNPNTYAYVESYLSPNSTSFLPLWMGVPHMGELPYVWGYGLLPNNPAVREDSGIFFDIVGWTPEDAIFADYQITLWTNFAKYGNPTPEPVKAPFDDSMTTWEKFSWDDGLKVFDFDYEIQTHENFRQQQNAFYYDYLSSISGRPLVKVATADQARPANGVRFNSATITAAMKKLVLDALIARGVEIEEQWDD